MSSSDNYTSGSTFGDRPGLYHFPYSLPEVPVPVDVFFRSVLPFVEPDLISKVVDHLVAQGRLVLDDTPKWAAFPVRPSKSSRPQDKVFRALGTVYQDIITAHKHLHSDQQESLRLVLRPGPRRSSIDPDPTLLDGSLAVNAHYGRAPDWTDIVLALEFKKHAWTDMQIDNAIHVLRGMDHIMRNDYRRFTFGLTIEDFITRVWFGDRSETMEPRLLVQVFLALAFATRLELGFDPTIERLPNNNIRILAQGETDGVPTVSRYIAHAWDDVLAEHGTEIMKRRGTRVWRVYEEGRPGIYYVLKDVWVKSTRTLEGDFLRDFRKDIEERGCAEDLAQFEELFMTVVADGVVVTSSGTTDHTHKLIRRGIRPRKGDSAELFSPGGTRVVYSLSGMPYAEGGNTKMIYCPRVHYRLVFKELGKPLDALDDLREFMGCLPKVVDGIELLHKYERLHRDISPGNIIVLFDDAGKLTNVKLSDLEYGQNGLEVEDEDMGAGTYEFMAAEVHVKSHWFLRLDSHPGMAGSRAEQAALILESLPQECVLPPKGFKRNVLHELESVWWIALWGLLYNYRSLWVGPFLSEPELVEFQAYGERLFGRSDAGSHRGALIISADEDEIIKVSDLLQQNPIITSLATRIGSYMPFMRFSYIALRARWNKREVLLPHVMNECRQFVLDLAQCAFLSS